MTNIGEISNPPIGGIRRRTGRNTGSVNVVIIAVAGLYWPGDIQLRMIRTIIANMNKLMDNMSNLTAAVMAIIEMGALLPMIRSINSMATY
jgi:hypothetical protein